MLQPCPSPATRDPVYERLLDSMRKPPFTPAHDISSLHLTLQPEASRGNAQECLKRALTCTLCYLSKAECSKSFTNDKGNTKVLLKGSINVSGEHSKQLKELPQLLRSWTTLSEFCKAIELKSN